MILFWKKKVHILNMEEQADRIITIINYLATGLLLVFHLRIGVLISYAILYVNSLLHPMPEITFQTLEEMKILFLVIDYVFMILLLAIYAIVTLFYWWDSW